MEITTSDFDYELPPEAIAQTPAEPRDHSRLLVVSRRADLLQHAFFYQLGQFLHPGDLLVLNETRVRPVRLFGRKIPSGGRVEILLLRREDETHWEALVGGKGLSLGKQVQIEGGPVVEIAAMLEGSRRRVRFEQPIDDLLDQIGQMPLPPYIHTPLSDPQRYQTVYARQAGSAAAPTAGLHFTPGLMADLQQQGIRFATVTLHVGLDTFAPVTEEHPHEHKIHSEWCQLNAATATQIQATRQSGGRVVAVGTTSVRTLESAARAGSGTVVPFEGPTDLFILPPFSFQAVDAMITNFHLPRSTLLMLVSAFAGRERILTAYQTAVQEHYRFYSFGDAMLIA